MPRYRFTQDYSGDYGKGEKDSEVELSEADAAQLNVDAPGTLVVVKAKHEPEPDAVPEPAELDADKQVHDAPHDRMMHKSKKRGAS